MVEQDIHEDKWIKSDIDTLISFGLTPKDRILDLGCGSGRHIFELKKRGLSNVVGLDLEIDFPGPGNFVKSDWNNLPFSDESFDFAYTIATGHSIEQKREEEVRRVLRFNSGFIFDTIVWEELVKKHQLVGERLVWRRIIDLDDKGGDKLTVQFDSYLDPASRTKNELVEVRRDKVITYSHNHGPIKVRSSDEYEQELTRLGFLMREVKTLHPELETNMLSPHTFILAVKQ